MDILNKDLVTDVFGAWPSFHDAEVLSLELQRGRKSNKQCVLNAAVNCYTVKTINEGTADFDTVLDKDYVIALEFHGVEQLYIEGFNHQNVIDDIEMSDCNGVTNVEFISIFGVCCKFTCKDIAVLSVKSMTEFNA
ncbi:immunity 50 family protein [Photobacterium makurazakiensis]|uniref:Imm50 family immunity protein n=1 Tax=Photobacterium makurazakiensis TaxID=2910234 RepID=UPI003D131AAE